MTRRPHRAPAGRQRRRCQWALALAVLCLAVGAPRDAHAYIGPGAGFALLSSFLVLFTTILVALASLLLWPFRMVWRLITRTTRAKAKITRLIIVGLDGQDPTLTDRYLRAGQLPNLAALAKRGCYHRLRTTFPSVSPVAWSSFSTGTQPARHNIFDFLDRDRRTYLPVLSSTRIGTVDRFLRLGRYRVPLRRPEIRMLRRSKPFWSILGEHRIWSTILRVPITFPPDRFYGAQLSAMNVPDLLGTQGTFMLYTTRPSGARFKEGGIRIPIELRGERADTVVRGPDNMFLDGAPPLEAPMRLTLDRAARAAQCDLDGQRVTLPVGVLSDWITVRFKAAPGITVSGICRLQLTELGEHVSLYMTPLNLDPERPAMPISHPAYYATYLAKRVGPYATLGLAEDTWALNEGVTDDATFLRQTYDIDRERQAMFFAGLDRLREGCLVCVFDATDRIQHMFWRYLEEGHPAARGGVPAAHRGAIEELYAHNDRFVGEVVSKLGEGDLLMVISDHGFSSFRRGVNLNSWLHAQGYLALKPGTDGQSEWLRDVDWSRTRAYALGLTGLFLNLRGREAQGIVEPGEAAASLKRELVSQLSGLRDVETGKIAIREAFDTAALYSGPYLSNAPDLIIGYDAGYRTSWDCATGIVQRPVFEDNVKAWSGDHCIDPRLVPGVFFCNRAIAVDEPALIDIAPTALDLFGLRPPKHMEGRSLFGSGAGTAPSPGDASATGPSAAAPAPPKPSEVEGAEVASSASHASRRRQPPLWRQLRGLTGIVLLTAALGSSLACGSEPATDRRVIVLGFDGMDYALTRELLGSGRLPNLARLAEAGGFSPLETTVPPQSPVAWSTFTTGLDPGAHGIFDFLHRDPSTLIPYLSTTRIEEGDRHLTLGRWRLPLEGGSVEALREGQPFWETLAAHDIESTVIRMPANFPPSGTATRELSGMGTPDVLGTYGVFSFFTSRPFAFAGRTISGGSVYEVSVDEGIVHAALEGPDNPLLVEPEPLRAEFTVYLDPDRPLAKIELGGQERVLQVGEWSDWIPFEFELLPLQTLPAMCRFYLRQVRPYLELYVTPLNYDPMRPVMPVSTPEDFAAELAEATGRFYTQGMPEETQGLKQGVLTPDDFLAQARLAGEEVREQYRWVLDRFDEGLLFYYVGNLDMTSHMMWRSLDPEHPAYDPEVDPGHAGVIYELYEGLDAMVGDTLSAMDADMTLIVMSDHGFGSWRRAFHLNAWLREQGYLAVLDPGLQQDPGFFANVDWSRTRAYGLGLNGLYLNLEGRERYGVVPEAQRDALLSEISQRLLATVDPATGEHAVARVDRPTELFGEVRNPAAAPDLLVGYTGGTRCSDESASGAVPREVIVDNTSAWSGDHCWAHDTVPGVLFTNRPLRAPASSLEQLGAAVLAEFGIAGFPESEP